jgi:hypothetical protein
MTEPSTTSAITPLRVTLWILVTGAGAFMIATGIVGMFVKAQ